MSGINIKEWTLAIIAGVICASAIYAILFVPGPHEAATAGLASAFSSIIGYFIGKDNSDRKTKDGE